MERYIKLQFPDRNGVNLSIGDTIEYWLIQRETQTHDDPHYVEHIGYKIEKVSATFDDPSEEGFVCSPGYYYEIDHFIDAVGSEYWNEPGVQEGFLKELREKTNMPADATIKQLIERVSGFTITEQFRWMYTA